MGPPKQPHARLAVVDYGMRAERLPHAPLPLPNGAPADCIGIPWCDKLLDLHVDMPQYVQP